ncbi:MAG TPA: cupin domain-containing protein, partial [Burkholderiales bacterium]
MKKAAAASLVALAVAAGIAVAQQPGFTRKLLQDQENISVQGRHVVQALAEFIPGGAAGKHTHPGEEFGYVVDGTIELTIEGQPPRMVKAGESFYVPAGLVHDGKNVGSGAAKV